MTTPTSEDHLQRRLKLRHIRFIALGTAIGTGLFYGSSETIQAAGPAVLISYIIAGFAVWIVMRALGEMAVRHPVAGSFANYADRFIGPYWGFITGWTFTFEMMVVAVADMTAVGKYMGFWYPDTPGWIWMVAALLIIAALNLLRVSVFGELEFWFTSIKITAIVAMIIGGLYLIVFGINIGGHQTGVENLVAHDGFAPFGVWGIIMSLGIVVFSFGGMETLGMTAGEADDPERAIPKAVNTVPVRILVFYVLSIGVMLCLIPWNQIGVDGSPFVQVFGQLGLPAAEHVMNGVVLTAALSAMNAIFYAGTRTMYGLAEQGQAPKSFLHTTRDGIPLVPVFIIVAVIALGLVAYFIIPDALFLVVASIATFATVTTWIMILISHHRMRRELQAAGAASTSFQLPGWPYLNYIAIAFMVGVMVILAFSAAGRTALIVGLSWMALLTLAYFFWLPKSARQRVELEPLEWQDEKRTLDRQDSRPE
ncbi:amino acid permease [Neomicrococcus aestuarii]|uniref:Proline-specific permease ProY n=1 Tax=Neomicrococcus aestuarii TaxID=556325 RepID=A0A1L2ZN86_9MICC|nr:amino acid permease [Neomicrococcus aestuarii]APF40885.1 proline-specific permease ProY [Neomicrococcus aestuarii]